MRTMDALSAPLDDREINGAPLSAPWRGAWRRWIRGVVFASGGMLSATIAGALFVVDSVTRATKASAFDAYNFTPFELNIQSENVRIPVSDTDSLAGWWLP